MKSIRWLVGVAVLCVLLFQGFTRAWWIKGHATIAEAAASRLPDKMPAFFRAGGKHLAHFAGEPDRWKNPKANHLRPATSADHYLDLEDLGGWSLPAHRWKAAELMRELQLRPERVGFLPYAIMENYDRLTCAFHDHRQDPNNTSIHMKCLVYAGILSHFTGDTVMPLHTTRAYDGKPVPGGEPLQKGIHAKIDAFPEKNDFSWEEVSRDLKPNEIEDMWPHILATILESHKHVERCYELDKAEAFDKPTPESRKFIMERCRAGTQFTMDLWYSAWVRSEKLPPHE